MNHKNKPIKIIAHRGGAWDRPENTLAAFSYAMDLGVDGLEMDVHLTEDQAMIVYHDFKLKPEITRNEKKEWIKNRRLFLKDLSLDALRPYDVGKIHPESMYAKRYPQQQAIEGEHIPELHEVFSLAKKKGQTQVKFYIELKFSALIFTDEDAQHQAMTNKILEEIHRFQMEDRVMLLSFDWGLLDCIRKANPNIARGYSTDEPFKDISFPHIIHALEGTAWVPSYKMLTKESVKIAHDLGLQVLPWTMNTKEDLQAMISMNVDGLITDHPRLAKELE